MSPTIYLVRHGEAENNIGVRSVRKIHLHISLPVLNLGQISNKIRDAVLTDHGKRQCQRLKHEFPEHDKISIVMSSPLRRAIQTASFAFGPAIRRQNVPYLLVPLGQEISDLQCDLGHSRQELEPQLPDLLSEGIDFDRSKIDFSLLEDGWNTKVSFYISTPLKLEAPHQGLSRANG